MRLTFEVIPEDYERHVYVVDWKDTLGLSEGYQGKSFVKRPKEVWCVITNTENDTLGYYKGLSTAWTFSGFQSNDTIIYLNFMIGLNIFTDKFESAKSKEAYEKMIRAYSEKNRLPLIFEPVRINLMTDLRKKYDLELMEK